MHGASVHRSKPSSILASSWTHGHRELSWNRANAERHCRKVSYSSQDTLETNNHLHSNTHMQEEDRQRQENPRFIFGGEKIRQTFPFRITSYPGALCLEHWERPLYMCWISLTTSANLLLQVKAYCKMFSLHSQGSIKAPHLYWTLVHFLIFFAYIS